MMHVMALIRIHIFLVTRSNDGSTFCLDLFNVGFVSQSPCKPLAFSIPTRLFGNNILFMLQAILLFVITQTLNHNCLID